MNLFNKKHTSIITVCMLLHIVNTAAMDSKSPEKRVKPWLQVYVPKNTGRDSVRKSPPIIKLCPIPESLFDGQPEIWRDYCSIQQAIDESYEIYNRNKPIIPHTITKNSSIVLDAQKHNAAIPFILLPSKISNIIFKHLINPECNIQTNIQNALALSAVCRHFDSKLANLGKQFAQHDQTIKNEDLKKRLAVINDRTYWSKRRALFLLVYAGVDHNNVYFSCPLLREAIHQKDTVMIKVLFKHKANPNLRWPILNDPALFSIETREIAALFTSQKDLNINASTELSPNVLWNRELTPELAAFYIDNNVNLRTLDRDNKSLLHNVASSLNFNSLSTVKLFITKIPDLINSLDKNNKTPLDILIKGYRNNKDELILLFRKYGAKTSQEIATEQA